jgi:hypothetical protein
MVLLVIPAQIDVVGDSSFHSPVAVTKWAGVTFEFFSSIAKWTFNIGKLRQVDIVIDKCVYFPNPVAYRACVPAMPSGTRAERTFPRFINTKINDV